jgi:CYTH domain-containing protein/CHAD domain-containing protein
MAAEIERKFLIERPPPDLERHQSVEIEQGYLAVSDEAEVRLRRAGGELTLTAKRGSGEQREELEVELSEEQFAELWSGCGEDRLEKRRYRLPLPEDLTAEVDVYAGELQGLAVAEVEFPTEESAHAFQPPPWFGRELTGDHRFANQALAIGGMPSDVSSDRNRSYGLKRDEELSEGLARVAAGRAEKALERLHGIQSGEADAADAIHGARKDTKKLRTVLRLLRDELPTGSYEEQNQLFRDAAGALSATRDAEVKLDTLDSLNEHVRGLPKEPVESWRLILETEREAAANAARDEPAMGEAVSRIETGLEAIEAWPLEGDSWRLIGGGLRRAYRRGRKAMRAAEADPSEPSFHEWRKRAKDLWYGLRLLQESWPRTLEATGEEAHQLSDLLGDHHDLAVLREDLHRRRLGAEETAALEAAIELRERELGEAAFDLGHRLYAERPKDFSRRLRRYWEAWRG